MKKFNPDLNTAIETNNRSIKYDMFCHRIGKIVKWYPERLIADIEILEKKKTVNGSIQNYPLLQEIPVLINYGNNAGLTLGDLTGCEVVLHFNDRDIDKWFLTGNSMIPNSERLHHINDCFAELRIFSQPNIISYDNTGVVLSNDAMKLKLTGGDNPEITLTNGNWTLSIVGDKATITGKMDITGAVKITGDVDVTGKITASDDVIGGGISLKTHTHLYDDTQPNGTPVQKSTQVPT